MGDIKVYKWKDKIPVKLKCINQESIYKTYLLRDKLVT